MSVYIVSATVFSMLVLMFACACHTYELDAVFSFKTSATGFSVPVRSESELCAPSVPRLNDLEPSVGDRLAVFDTKLIIGFDFATTRSSSPIFSSCCLFDIWDLLIDFNWLQEKQKKLKEQTETMIPHNKSEVAFRQQVSYLVFDVNKFDLDVGFQVDSVKQPIQRDSVGSGYVSHHWTSSFDDHLDHWFCLVKKCTTEIRLWNNLRL